MRANPQQFSDSPPATPGRLDSWKEIAAFFGRDVRTVRRWEQERSLPVHRFPGRERSGVFAYTAELETWVHASPLPAEDFASASTDSPELAGRPAPLQFPSQPVGLNGTYIVDASSHEGRSDLDPPSEFSPARRLPLASIAVALLLLAAGVASLAFARNAHRTSKSSSATGQPHVTTPEAQDLYLRGRYFWNLRSEGDLTKAIDLFTQAIVHDPRYAPAYAGLADSYLLLREFGHMPDAEAFPRALAAAEQAVVLDDQSPEAHRSLAFVAAYWLWDTPRAEVEFRRALALAPNDAQAHHWFATALFSAGRFPEALDQIDQARTLSPQSISVLADRDLILSMSDPAAAMADLRQLELTDPSFPSIPTYLAGIELRRSEYAAFLAEWRKTLINDPRRLAVMDAASRALASSGPQAMLITLANQLAPLADQGHGQLAEAAGYFALAGDRAHLLIYLDRSCARHEPAFLGVRTYTAFDPYRNDAAFRAILARCLALPAP